MKKKLILAIIILIIVAFIVYQNIKKNGQEYVLADVVYGNISQEISETGQVQMGDSINLGFKAAGTIERIYVSVGDKVFFGSSLAKLNTVQLTIEQNEALANLEIAKAKLNQLLEGATSEEIKLAETEVANAQTALYDVQQEYQEDLKQANDDAINILDSAFLEAVEAQNTIVSIRKKYFSNNDQASTIVKEKEQNIKKLVLEIEESVLNAKNSLSGIYSDLGSIRNQTETSNYADVVLAADKTSLDAARSDINTALTSVVNAQQAIVSAELTGSAAVNVAQGKLNKAKDELSLKTAEPSTADVALYQAQVRQAQAKVDLLNNNIWDSTLRSPIKGQVINVNKEIGENWQPSLTESVITILPDASYEIKVDIYEEDVVEIVLGNDVNISLIAFPDKVFQGKVISIDPSEKTVDSVIYYATRISFNEAPESLRPGMTADLAIRTAFKENVLVVPDDAIQIKDKKTIVQVLKNNKTEDREIEIGLKGVDGLAEIISGLAEGDQVIVK